MMRRAAWFVALACTLAQPARAESPGVFVAEARAPLDEVYKGVYKALEKAGWYVAFEMDMFKGMSSSLPRKLGEDFNRAGLEGIRTMVFCQGVHANAIMNADPDMMALCPLHLTVIHRAGTSKVLFARPAAVAKGSPAEGAAKAVEDEVIGIIRAGVPSQ
jgi:uncharacterized protein (DUF302 family)